MIGVLWGRLSAGRRLLWRQRSYRELCWVLLVSGCWCWKYYIFSTSRLGECWWDLERSLGWVWAGGMVGLVG
jgi:hypothetical protein